MIKPRAWLKFSAELAQNGIASHLIAHATIHKQFGMIYRIIDILRGVSLKQSNNLDIGKIYCDVI